MLPCVIRRVVLKFVKKRFGFLPQKTPLETLYPFANKLKKVRLKAPFNVCTRQSLRAELYWELDNCYSNIIQWSYMHYIEFFKPIPVTHIYLLGFIGCDTRFWANDRHNFNNNNNNNNNNNASYRLHRSCWIYSNISHKVG